MTDLFAKRPSGCPVAFGLDTFGDRWTLLIIREMLLGAKKTYGAFLEAEEGISTNILANRLKQLEADGLVEKRRDPENFRSFLYDLTDKGYALAPVLFAIIRWSGQYDSRSDRLTGMVERLAQDEAGLLAEIEARRARDRAARA
ncbi:winged helix-turn-helix transcriptional regulator [Arenibacterium sp. LLYu02]|uniref:winged helix-turn-helix transcriptional regulator n=1 Tax=Arenibacterium sp. LLYu02 TaxID=3404132 RepID=UPI003B213172